MPSDDSSQATPVRGGNMRGVGRGSPRGVGRGSPPAVGRGQQSRPQQPQTSPQVADVLAQMTGLLNSLTLRVTQKEVHEPPKFNLNSGISLEQFFREFEEYASQKFGVTNQQAWLSRLSEYMSAPLLSLCESLVRTGASYITIKQCLLDSYGKASMTRTVTDYVKEFQSCTYDSSEGIRGLVSRLRVLGAKAYSGVDQYTLDQLVKEQCLTALPEKLRTPLSFQHLTDPSMPLSELIRIGTGLQNSVYPVEAASVTKEASEATGAVAKVPVPVRSEETPVTVVGRGRQRSRGGCNCLARGHRPEDCDWSNGRCFTCHQSGHFSNQCPQKQQRSRTASRGRGIPCNPTTQRSVSNVSREPITSLQVCPFCGQQGHFMSTCVDFSNYMKDMIKSYNTSDNKESSSSLN